MTRKPGGLPSKAEILRFIAETPGKIGKREIAQAFGIKGNDKIALKRLLKDMTEAGELGRGPRREIVAAGGLPSVTVIEITGLDGEGTLLAKPADWQGDGPPPAIAIVPSARGGAVGVGDRALARLDQTVTAEEDGQPATLAYDARIIKKLARAERDVLGIYQVRDGRGRIVPTNRKHKQEYHVARADAGEAQPGDLVLAKLLPGKRLGLRPAEIVEILGDAAHPKAPSLIALHGHGIPHVFPEAAVAEAAAAKPPRLEGYRTDLRNLPLVTIDGADARDFDDAVLAAKDDDPNNPGGWRLWVAIADVSLYVRPGAALDLEAAKRGNSTYFPDRVVPMLPEALSNGLCSLNPGEDRACLAVEMVIDAKGRKKTHRFARGLMKSAARLTYTQAQAAIDGRPDEATAPLLDTVIAPLYGAYKALAGAREARGPLALDLPETKIVLDDTGRIVDVALRERFDSHKLIEEFMILANVCAAETLEDKRQPCMYRVHRAPGADKLEALADFLATLDLSFTLGQALKPAMFNGVLRQAHGKPYQDMVNDVVLRSQTQAYYAPENEGHFGLALRRYAHFTSPIRRYADLLVHRALIRGLSFGPGGLSDNEIGRFDSIGEAISQTERRSMAAEREATDRFMVAYLADRVGATFPARIASCTRFGLFVRLADSGADGLVPIQALPPDYYHHDEAAHTLTGDATGLQFRLGDKVTVRLDEADPITGSLRFELVEGGQTVKGGKRRRPPTRGKGGGAARRGRPPRKRR